MPTEAAQNKGVLAMLRPQDMVVPRSLDGWLAFRPSERDKDLSLAVHDLLALVILGHEHERIDSTWR